MKILRSVLEYLNNEIKNEPPEIGGIFGSEDGGETVSLVLIDKNEQASRCCSYIPNTQLLNSTITKWLNNGIAFMGIFHTHFGNSRLLSYSDKLYIESIMKVMPQEIKELYFPIYTLPKRELIVYKAWLKAGILQLQEEPIEII